MVQVRALDASTPRSPLIIRRRRESCMLRRKSRWIRTTVPICPKCMSYSLIKITDFIRLISYLLGIWRRWCLKDY